MSTLTSCATSYKRFEGNCTPALCPSGGGYQDVRIKDDTWYLLVQGNGLTSPTTVTQYFYRRAKEICQENNYTDYKIENADDTTAGYSATATATIYGASGSVTNWPKMTGNVICIKK